VLPLLVLLLAMTAELGAQTPAPPGSQPAPPPAAQPGAASDRVPVPEPTAQAQAYHRSGNVLWVLNTLWALVLPAALLWTGLSARMRDWAQAAGRKWFFAVALYWVIFAILTTAVDLPRVYYESFMREHAYGLSNQTLGKWASDQAAGLGVTLVIGALVLWVPYLLLARSPRRWWLYTGALAVPFIVLIVLVQPIWIDPLFNRFGPMKDASLEAEIVLLLYAVHRLSTTLIDRFGARFGFSSLADVASLPLVLMLFSGVSLVTDPVALAAQRYFEHEADRFALEVTRDNHAGAMAFAIMQQENLVVPRPGRLYTWFRMNHPPVGERIDFFNDYRPWESGQPLVYGHLFRKAGL
jgi:hypothetical protein